MMRGAFVLSAAIFLSKFLGMLFVIPLSMILDEKGISLYVAAYNPYAILLSISTVGLPMAVSKYVSRYNAMGEYHVGNRLFKRVSMLMIASGVIGFLIMYSIAPLIARSTFPGKPEYFQGTVLTIHMLSFALLIVPVMSIIRGYFQGYQSMEPTAISQVIEQVVRIVFGLVGAGLIIYIFNGSQESGAAIVTFGAFVGALFGLLYIARLWLKRKPEFDRLAADSPDAIHPPFLQTLRELVSYAIPFAVVGLAIMLYQQVDQMTIHKYMDGILGGKAVTHYFNYLMFQDQKLVMIPVSLSTALAVSVVPAITDSFTKGDHQLLDERITKAFQYVIFLTLPAVAGLSVLGYMITGMLYGGIGDGVEIAGYVLRWFAPTAILFAGFSVSAAILQGVNRQKVSVFSLCVGLLLKMILNPIFILWFVKAGPILATDIGYLVSISINLIAIKRRTGYDFKTVFRRGLFIVLITLVMVAAIQLVLMLGGHTVPESRLSATLFSVIGILVGGLVYLVLSGWSGLLKIVLGSRFPLVKKFSR